MSSAPDFALILEQLTDTSQPLPMASLYHLSDLSGEDLAALEAVWPELPTERRLAVMQDLNELGEANFEVSFESVFRLGLEDEAPAVRATAIQALWESDDPALIGPFVDFMQHDPEVTVRAAAASALGRFVYLGELDELAPMVSRRLVDALLEVVQGEDDLEVRRRALEAVAYSGRPEVQPLIAEAYESPEHKLRVSAVHAMGRNADKQRWSRQVRAELESTEPEMRFEAVRAAGELELTSAAGELADLTDDADIQVQEAAIWSLGQVGGDVARAALTDLLERSEDEEEQDYIQAALDNLNFTDEVHAFTLFELGEGGELDLLEDELDEADQDYDDEEDDED